MAHEITTEDKGVFHRLAWHGLLKVFGSYMTTQECIEASGLNYQHTKVPALAEFDGTRYEIPDAYAVVRMDTGKPISVVGGRYSIIQHDSMFKCLDGIVQESDAKFASAFTTHGGKRVHMLITMPGSQICGEDYEQWIFATNSHDGSTKFKLMPTAVRVVCANTVALAEASTPEESKVQVRHTKSGSGLVLKIPELLKASSMNFKLISETMQHLDREAVDADYREQFFMQLLGDKPDEKGRGQTIWQDKKEQLIAAYHHTTNEMLDHTKYRLFNSVSYWTDHMEHTTRGLTDSEASFNRSIGTPKMKEKALALLTGQQTWSAA